MCTREVHCIVVTSSQFLCNPCPDVSAFSRISLQPESSQIGSQQEFLNIRSTKTAHILESKRRV